MGKQSKSTTQNTYPQWLSAILEPYIGGSVARNQEFQGQGYNVLQGRPYNEGMNLLPPGNWAKPKGYLARDDRGRKHQKQTSGSYSGGKD